MSEEIKKTPSIDQKRERTIFSLFDADVDYGESTTFQAELNRQCYLILKPTAIVAIFCWLPYIILDKALFQSACLIVCLRVGFTLVAITSLILRSKPFFKKYSYWLLFILCCYFELITAVILGLVKAHPAYMGGYAMLLLVVPLMPFKKIHSIIMLSSSLLIFTIMVFSTSIKFDTLPKKYGLYNLVGAAVVSCIAILVLDNIRKVNFEISQENYLTNMKLKVATIQIFTSNEELKEANELKSKLLEIAAHDL